MHRIVRLAGKKAGELVTLFNHGVIVAVFIIDRFLYIHVDSAVHDCL